MQDFCSFFGIRKGITALIGGGGKTSTMYALADGLRRHGSVIVCTSTHILKPPQYPYLPNVINRLQTGEAVSTGVSDGVKLTAPKQPFNELRKLCDYVLVEADGSRQLPLKAHAAHEPVIPEGTETVLVLIGIDGLGKPIREAAHRPELFSQIVHQNTDAIVTNEMIRKVVETYPRCDGIIINKADDSARIKQAESLAKMFSVPVVVTAWKTEHPIKAYRRY